MTHKNRILNVLEDGQWHTFRELLGVYFKYTQRIFDLRQDGYIIEERQNLRNKAARDYRLVKEPSEQAKPRFTHLNKDFGIKTGIYEMVLNSKTEKQPELF